MMNNIINLQISESTNRICRGETNLPPPHCRDHRQNYVKSCITLLLYPLCGIYNVQKRIVDIPISQYNKYVNTQNQNHVYILLVLEISLSRRKSNSPMSNSSAASLDHVDLRISIYPSYPRFLSPFISPLVQAKFSL